MTNSTEQTEAGKKYVSHKPKKEDPPILSILRSDEDTGISPTLPEGITTPAELLINKELTPAQKKLELQRMWGRKGGRKSAIKKTKWKDIFVEVAQQLAAIGVPETDIAALFQVTQGTFTQWKRSHQPLRQALKEGESMKRANLTMQMQAGAAAGQYVTQIFLAKNWLGMTDKQDVKMSGEQTIIYKSSIPKEKGVLDVDPGSIKKSTKKLQDRD